MQRTAHPSSPPDGTPFASCASTLVAAAFVLAVLWGQTGGLYHAFTKHGVGDGFAAVFIPPLAWWRGIEMFWHSDNTQEEPKPPPSPQVPVPDAPSGVPASSDQLFSDTVTLALFQQSQAYEKSVRPFFAQPPTPDNRDKALRAWGQSIRDLRRKLEDTNTHGVDGQLCRIHAQLTQAVKDSEVAIGRGWESFAEMQEPMDRLEALALEFQSAAKKLGLRLAAEAHADADFPEGD